MSMLTVLLISIVTGIIPASQSMRDVSALAAIASGYHAMISDVDYILDVVGRFYARVTAIRAEPPVSTTRSITSPDYIMIGNAGVSVSAMRDIARNVSGDEMMPVRNYGQNQLSVRNAHDVLVSTGVIEAGRGSRGPRIKNRREWDQIVERIR